MQDTQGQVAGALLGLACGDALGAPLEFQPPALARARYGRLTEMVGGGLWVPGEWTDDTGMALCVAGGILADPADPVPGAGARFLEWRRTAKDVGSTIGAALSGFHGDWPEAARNTPQARSGKAGGNGSLMRTLPVALAYPDAQQVAAVGARLSAVTHWDPQAEVCCLVYDLWVSRLLRGEGRREAWEAALADARETAAQGRLAPDTPGSAPLPPDFWPRLQGIEGKKYADLQPSGYAGYVVECLEAAVWCVLDAGDAEESIIQAANLAGEADTIAAVAGGAAGAYWGHAALPTRWLDALHQRPRLEETATRLADLRRHHEVYATPDLPPFSHHQPAERVHTGRNPLTAWDVAQLRSLGVTHVLDLREEWEWTAPGKWGREALDALAGHGVTRRSVPIPDGAAPATGALDAACRFMAQALADPAARVYVHCRAGRERTGAVLLAWLGRAEGAAGETLRARLRPYNLRPMAHQVEAARAWLRHERTASGGTNSHGIGAGFGGT